MNDAREQVFLQEGSSFPGKTYAEVVLQPAFQEAKRHLLAPLIAVNKAQLIMLREQQLISEADAQAIARALHRLDPEEVRRTPYSGQFEDLFFLVERRLLAAAGEAAGNLHLGRSRNDIGVTMYRLVLRDKLLHSLESALFLAEQLLSFAEAHTETVMLGYTHMQQAQPTTLAHYATAVSDVLERDIKRLMHAYRTVNKSSMGAAALTTSGFPLSRERMKELLAFDDIVENAYDAVAGADYLGETAAAVHVAATNLGRAIQDLLLWCTQEFAVLRVADPYVQASSIMPQKRNPVSLEHLRSLLSSAAGNAATVLTMMHNTPFGDIVDTEDDMQPYVWRSLSLLEQLYRLLACVIATLEVDRQRLLERARQSFATLTELADTLVRTDNLPFRKAHQIVSRVGREAMRLQLSADQLSLDLLNQVAQEVIGRRLQLSAEQLRQALDPLHFVTVRALPGGPNPEVVKRMIAERRKRLGAIAEWVGTTRQTIAQAQRSLDQVVEGWSEAR